MTTDLRRARLTIMALVAAILFGWHIPAQAQSVIVGDADLRALQTRLNRINQEVLITRQTIITTLGMINNCNRQLKFYDPASTAADKCVNSNALTPRVCNSSQKLIWNPGSPPTTLPFWDCVDDNLGGASGEPPPLSNSFKVSRMVIGDAWPESCGPNKTGHIYKAYIHLIEQSGTTTRDSGWRIIQISNACRDATPSCEFTVSNIPGLNLSCDDLCGSSSNVVIPPFQPIAAPVPGLGGATPSFGNQCTCRAAGYSSCVVKNNMMGMDCTNACGAGGTLLNGMSAGVFSQRGTCVCGYQ